MGKETSNGTRFGRGKGGTDVLPEAQGVGVGERKIANVVEVDGIKRCSAVISGRACNATIKPPGRFCEKCGAKLVYSDGRRETQFLASQGGRVEMVSEGGHVGNSRTSVDLGKTNDVEPDPAGRYDADAVKAALGVEEGRGKGDWDPEIARTIDVSDMEYVPGKGYVKKKEADKR